MKPAWSLLDGVVWRPEVPLSSSMIGITWEYMDSNSFLWEKRPKGTLNKTC